MRISRPYIAIQLTAAIGVLYLVFYLPRRQAAIPSEAILSEPTIIRQKTPEGTTIEYLPGSSYASAHTRTKTIVFARPQSGDVYWLPIADSNTTIAIYVVDNPSLSPDYTIPQNKGREAMVYLTYIIDHYENLSDVSIFTHSYMISSHNNDLLDSSMLQTIQHLSLPHVARVGVLQSTVSPRTRLSGLVTSRPAVVCTRQEPENGRKSIYQGGVEGIASQRAAT